MDLRKIWRRIRKEYTSGTVDNRLVGARAFARYILDDPDFLRD